MTCNSFFSFIHGAGSQFVPSKPDFLNVKRDAVLPTTVFLSGDMFHLSGFPCSQGLLQEFALPLR